MASECTKYCESSVCLCPCDVWDKIIDKGVAKTKYFWWKMLLMGFLAGVYISFGSHLAIIVGKGLEYKVLDANKMLIQTVKASKGLSALMFGAVYPLGNILVSLAGAEKVSGNMGIIIPALLRRKITLGSYLKSISFVFLGNFIGCVFYAYFGAFMTDSFKYEPYLTAVRELGIYKTSKTFFKTFLMGVGANWLVNLAFVQCLSAKHVSGKIMGI